jgi:uroporphyrinogen-III synthase
MPMRVLIIRPVEDATLTAQRLEALGHTAIVAPLISVQFINGPELNVTGTQAILATSANGVRGLARRMSARDLPLYVVGSHTAATARALGFTSVIDADGNSIDLAHLVRRSADPGAGRLLYAFGDEISFEFVGTLAKFKVHPEPVYATPAANALPSAAATAIRAGEIDTVLHFSARTASVFCELVTKAGLAAHCETILAVCISDASAGALSTLNFREIRVANAPNQDALLACLG